MDQNPEGQGQKSIVGNNQPNPTPAAPSGAIFSGSSAPTGATPAGAPNQPTSGSSRPFFAHHPTHTFSREMGDIVVGGTAQPQKKRKTGLIIGSIILAIMALGAIIAILIFSGSSQQGDMSVISSFNRYANYINTGNAATDSPQELGDPFNSYLVSAMQSGDQETIAVAFDEAQKLLDEFIATYQQGSTNDELVSSLVDMNQNQLNALQTYAQIDQLDSITMVALYLNNGPESMLQTAHNTYDTIANSQDSILSTIGNGKIQIANNLVIIYDFYLSQGCIAGGVAQDVCIEQLILPEQVISARDQIAVLELETTNQEKKLVTNVFAICENTLSALDPNENNAAADAEETGEA